MRRFQNWFFLGLMYGFFYMSRYNFSAVQAAVAGQFGWSHSDYGSVLFAGLFTYGCAVFFNGPLADRIGGKRAILIGAAGAAVFNLLFGLGHLLIVTPAVTGSGGQIVTPAVLASGMQGSSAIALFAGLWACNHYFQSFGALSIVKVNVQWFHISERGTFAGIFGVMIQGGRTLACAYSGGASWCVDVTQALSRNRTAIAALYELLARYPDLAVGQFVPVGALWDVLFGADNVQALRQNSRSKMAQNLADTAETWRRIEGKVDAVSTDQKADPKELRQAVRTTLMCQLSDRAYYPDGRPLREGVTVGALLRLNHADIKATTERTGISKLSKLLRNLSGVAPQVIVGSGTPAEVDPIVQIKTDKIDARVLAELARVGYLPEVWLPDEDTEALRQFITDRTSLVRRRTECKNCVHSILHRNLVSQTKTDLFGTGGRHWLETIIAGTSPDGQLIPELDRLRLGSLLNEIDRIDAALVDLIAERYGYVDRAWSEARDPFSP